MYENRVQRFISEPKKVRQHRNEEYYIMRRLINSTYLLTYSMEQRPS
jgi:LPS O-antigen subunit length determinant protein (WzzB/FepE family)